MWEAFSNSKDFLSFLDMKGLAAFEQAAALDVHIRTTFWKKPVAEAIDQLALWGPSAPLFLVLRLFDVLAVFQRLYSYKEHLDLNKKARLDFNK